MRGGRRILFVLLAHAGFVAPMDSLRAGVIGGAADVVLLCALILLVLITLATGRWRRPGATYLPVLVAAFTLALAGLIGTFFSAAPGTSVLNVVRFSVAVGGMLLLFSQSVARPNEVRCLMWAYVLGVTMSAAYSLTHVNPYTQRGEGLAFHSNALGLTCVFAMCLAYGLVSTATRSGRRLGLGCLSVLGLGLLNSGSRAALIALTAATLTFVAVSQNRTLLRYGTFAAAMAGGAVFAGWYTLPAATAIDRLFTTSELTSQSDAERTELRGVTIVRISAHPLTGSGFANATAAHNLPLQVIESAGVLGGLAFSALVWAILKPLIRRRRDPMIAGSLAMYIGYLVAGLASPPLWDRWLWFPVACGVALTAQRTDTHVESSKNSAGGSTHAAL
jgi:O-antigen ligase